MKSTLRCLLVALLLITASGLLLAQHVIATIPIHNGPGPVAVNQKTNRVYTGNGDQSVSIINGTTNVVLTTVTVHGSNPSQRPPLVYSSKNEIFVGDPEDSSVDVIDGRTNTVRLVPTSFAWWNGSVQLGTSNWLYVLGSSEVDVVDANDLSVAATIPLANTEYIAANQNTGLVYAASFDSDSATWSIAVIDSSINAIVNTFPLGTPFLWGISVDSTNNRLYVIDTPSLTQASSLLMLDGTTGAVLGTSQPLGQALSILAIPSAHKVIVGGGKTSPRGLIKTLLFIDSDTLAVTKVLKVGASPTGLAYNPVTKRIYVVNSFDSTLSVIGN